MPVKTWGYKEWKKPQGNLYIHRFMAKMILATTSNTTSIDFSMDHMCRKHNVLFTMEHVEACNEIQESENIRKYARRLKEEIYRVWEPEERLKAITEFALLTIQMKNLEHTR